MGQTKRICTLALLTISMMVLILDSRTSLQGAKDGIMLCITVVIPSLFPFLFLSAMLPSRLIGSRIPGLRTLGRICKIPEGAESLLLLGFLGGYPVGAGIITEAYKQGSIPRSTAEHMLGFCSNAGPAFIFGMIGGLFSSASAVWVLWLIHILSALSVGIILPSVRSDRCVLNRKLPVSVPQALDNTTRVMVNICGWVIIFRVILAVLDRWLLWLIPLEIQTGISGILELSNGIINLRNISNTGSRFVLCAGMLSFGGLCVSMQTVSVTKGLGMGRYFPGKILQCFLSVFLAAVIQHFLFPQNDRMVFDSWHYLCMLTAIGLTIIILRSKKSSSIIGANIV